MRKKDQFSVQPPGTQPQIVSIRRNPGRVVSLFIASSCISLLLFAGALAFQWQTARVLQREISSHHIETQYNIGAMIALFQASWAYYSSPGEEHAYLKFSEKLETLPAPLLANAIQVAAASEFTRKNVSARGSNTFNRDDFGALSQALSALASEGLSLTEQRNAGKLLIMQSYQNQALLLTVVALFVAALAGFGILLHVKRIEGTNATQHAELLREQENLKSLSARLLAAQEEERRAIARELHDSISQSLGVLALDASRAGSLTPADHSQLQAIWASIRQNADQLLQVVRDMALGLRPSMLDDLGLAAALDWLARETSRRNNVEVNMRVEGLDADLPDELRTCIYRVVQEGLSNAARHAEAKNIDVEVEHEGPMIRIEVHDDGRGFDPKLKQGLGLIGAAERLSALGGKLSLDSQPGSGTRFLAQLPVPQEIP